MLDSDQVHTKLIIGFMVVSLAGGLLMLSPAQPQPRSSVYQGETLTDVKLDGPAAGAEFAQELSTINAIVAEYPVALPRLAAVNLWAAQK